jgi:hypothetical protein
MELKKIVLKVIHPFVVAGRIIAGGELIEMLEHEAKQLLDGGKVELATSDDDAKPVTASTVPVPGAQQAPAGPVADAVEPAAAQPSTPAPAVDAAPAADTSQTQQEPTAPPSAPAQA